MVEAMLSTIDNPHHPFDDYTAWLRWDERKGYYTNSFLARLVLTSDALSEADSLLAIERAVDDAVRENVSGLYIKVEREISETGLDL